MIKNIIVRSMVVISSWRNHLKSIRELFAIFPHKGSFPLSLHPANGYIVYNDSEKYDGDDAKWEYAVKKL